LSNNIAYELWNCNESA